MPLGEPWPSLGLRLGRPSTSTMLSLWAASGAVDGAKVKVFSSLTLVGLQMSGLVPIEQNNIRRVARLVPAACSGRRRSIDANGSSNKPAPAP